MAGKQFEYKKGMKLLFLLTFLVSTQVAHAKVSVEDTRPVPLPEAPVMSWSSSDISKVIPLDLTDEMPNNEVINRIGDNAFQNWLNGPVGRNNSVARTALRVQNSMKSEVALRNHKFTFQVLAFQGASRVKYTGWLNAELNYSSNQTKFEISEQVWKNKSFIISHSADKIEDISSVGLRWNW